MNTPWRRRREAVQRPQRPAADHSLTTAILTLTAGALLTLTTGLMVMQQLEQFGPAIGGIIVFKPDAMGAGHWAVKAAIVEPTPSGASVEAGARYCMLSPSLMTMRGGSLVIEARRMSRPPVFRVHWAGGPTDTGTSDCGIVADLVLERTELMRLANAAGGFTSGLRLIGP
jgi:hypothetical protein